MKFYCAIQILGLLAIPVHPVAAQTIDSAKAKELRENWESILSQSKALAKEMRFSPSDASVFRTVGNGRSIVVQHNFSLEFFEFPFDVELMSDKKWRSVLIFGGKGLERKQIGLEGLKSTRKIVFKNSIAVHPTESGVIPQLLVCSQPMSGYAPPIEEDAVVAEIGSKVWGNRYAMPWENAVYDLDDFCGVISVSGSILYKFPIVQKYPDSILKTAAYRDGGNWVAVALGESVMAQAGDESHPYAANFRKLFVWEGPGSTMKSFPIPIGTNYETVVENAYRSHKARKSKQ